MPKQAGIVTSGEAVKSNGLDLDLTFKFFYQATAASKIKVQWGFNVVGTLEASGYVTYLIFGETKEVNIGLFIDAGEQEVVLPAATLCSVTVNISGNGSDECSSLLASVTPLP